MAVTNGSLGKGPSRSSRGERHSSPTPPKTGKSPKARPSPHAADKSDIAEPRPQDWRKRLTEWFRTRTYRLEGSEQDYLLEYSLIYLASRSHDVSGKLPNLRGFWTRIDALTSTHFPTFSRLTLKILGQNFLGKQPASRRLAEFVVSDFPDIFAASSESLPDPFRFLPAPTEWYVFVPAILSKLYWGQVGAADEWTQNIHGRESLRWYLSFSPLQKIAWWFEHARCPQFLRSEMPRILGISDCSLHDLWDGLPHNDSALSRLSKRSPQTAATAAFIFTAARSIPEPGDRSKPLQESLGVATSRLLLAQQDDGSFEVASKQPPSVGATAMAILALSEITVDDRQPSHERKAVEKGGAWLKNQQQGGGAWHDPHVFSDAYLSLLVADAIDRAEGRPASHALRPNSESPAGQSENVASNQQANARHTPESDINSVLENMRHSRRVAWLQYRDAEHVLGHKCTDDAAYDWVRQNRSDDDGVARRNKLPSCETWKRYLREARKTLKQNKNRSGGLRTSRSVVSFRDI